MTQKHFIALADTIREHNKYFRKNNFSSECIDSLALFCYKQNKLFNVGKWTGYLYGTNGPNGGKVKYVNK